MNFKIIKLNGIDKTRAENFLNSYTPKKDKSNLKIRERKEKNFEEVFKVALKNEMCGGGIQ